MKTITFTESELDIISSALDIVDIPEEWSERKKEMEAIAISKIQSKLCGKLILLS